MATPSPALQASRTCGKIRLMITMNAPAPTDPKELRPLVHADIERIPDEHLAAVHRLLLESEIERLTAELGEETEAAWQQGDITDEKIAEAVKEYRRAHPYGR